jgi:predicted Zn-dependent protease
VTPVPACRARFELLLGRGTFAGSDGHVVHLGERFFERFRDDEIAVIVAHELAHVILRHPQRLTAAGVDRGMLRELGRNGRLHRRTEGEADELSVHLLANAGFDPLSAARFWRERGGEIDAGVFRARTHPSSRSRAAALELVARSIVGRPRPTRPALLATRDAPLD